MIRVMALHALEYCERLFFLEEVEEIRVADIAVFDGRRFHEQLPQYVNLEQFTLESEDLGIYGKVDCIRQEHGDYVPYEYKKGHARVLKSGEVLAWPSDELQIAAYAMLLEEATKQTVAEGRVYYASDHRTAVVSIDGAVRTRVKQAIGRARTLRQSTERPPIAENERLCVS